MRTGRARWSIPAVLSIATIVALPPARIDAADSSRTQGTRADHVADAARRYAAVEAALHAWITVDLPRATMLAADFDEAAASGAASGPLDGLVIAVKDNIDTADFPTTAGSASLRGRRPTRDATAVALVREAGGIVLGKTNLDTFARGVRTVSEVGGATANAWDPARGPGGSSGGTAVAVASGVADAGLGSDTCGSLRYPAAYNGVFGLRPTPGRVSRAGLVPLAPTHDVVGPIARDVHTLAALFRVIAAPDWRDPLTSSAPPRGRPGEPFAQKSALRVGVVRSMGPYRRDASGRTALDVLADAGIAMADVTLPKGIGVLVIEDEAPRARQLFLRVASDDGGATVPAWLEPDGLDPDARDRALSYRRHRAAMAEGQRRLGALLDRLDLDALVHPTTPYVAARRGAAQPSGNCALASSAGLPALAVPHGLGVDGIPTVGVDLVARPFDEETLLDIASRYEAASSLPRWDALHLRA